MSDELLKQDQKWMRYALTLAAKAEALSEVPVGAVVVKDDVLVAEGWNQPITSNDPTAHAEVVAIRAAAQALQNYRLVGCTLYVTIEPCTMCAGSLIHSRVDRVVYGALEPKAGAVESQLKLLNSAHFNHSVSIQSGVLAVECRVVISDFFKKRRAQKNRR
jgi:tRNA(adenine34) deaminase